MALDNDIEIASFDYFYRHFLFQKNQQGFLEKKICNKVQVEVFAHLGWGDTSYRH